MNVAIVILHYETIDDTLGCVKSLIENNENTDFDIVIVDNGSKKGIIKIDTPILQAKNVHLIRSDTNLGFANGNNLGFKYSKDVLDAEIIILANNDIVFNQFSFVAKLIDLYRNDNFDVAGPKIISLVDGMNQNPVRINFRSVEDVKKRLLKFKALLVLNYLGLDKAVRSIIGKKIIDFIPDENEGYQLHGACVIFGKNYINQFDGLYRGTFMYAEEDFLYQRILKNGLKVLYLDSLEVRHKEGSSTNQMAERPVNSRRFFYKWSINSLSQLVRYMNGELIDEIEI